jgi:hypothetical protein
VEPESGGDLRLGLGLRFGLRAGRWLVIVFDGEEFAAEDAYLESHSASSVSAAIGTHPIPSHSGHRFSSSSAARIRIRCGAGLGRSLEVA